MDNEMYQTPDVLMEEEKEKPKCDDKDAACFAVGFQEVDVCIPVTIKPFGEAGNAKTQCVGRAVVSYGTDKCHDKPCDECKFTICQKLRVEVPVVFGARAEVGDASVDCKY